MITDCPSCSRQFRVYAWQLSAAKGTVQCGFCGEQFNALERLHDLPLASSHENTKPSKIDDELDEPQFSIPGEDPVDNKQDIEIDDFVHETISEEPEAEEHSLDTHGDEPLPDLDETVTGDEDVLDILGEPAESRSIWGSLFWFAAVSLLIVTIVSQLLWFNRDWILTSYPEYLSLARKVCEQLECEVMRARDLQSIVLLNRDVRDHPRYADTLLVNATIENQSGIVQAYPDLRLTLYNTEGQITGYRSFKPEEYLDNSIRIEDGMPVSIPVHIILELTGSTETAVSFEFNFI